MTEKSLWLVEFLIVAIVLLVVGSTVMPQIGMAGP